VTRVVVTGASGRMGAAILRLALADPELAVTGALEAKGHPAIGKGIGSIIGDTRTASALKITDSLEALIDHSDVVVDFTAPSATAEYFREASAHGKGIVIGTTGLTQEAISDMKKTSTAKAVVSPNMSIAVNLLFNLVERASRALGPEYDPEIIEMHHRLKKDAPSGTAIRLRQAIEAGRPQTNWSEVTGRQGLWGERKPEEIGVLAVRAGDIVGEHTVFFAGPGERIELTHRATSREIFARGALLAAKWLNQQAAPGIYDMKDVLGLV
jgi:4-hydroxy-tetrahydrodipicolinate reductase